MDSTVYEVLEQMQKEKATYCVVTAYQTQLKGIFSLSDFIQKVLTMELSAWKTTSIQNLMTPNPLSLMNNHPIYYAINNILHFKVRGIVICNEDRYPESVVTTLDIIRYLNGKL